MSMVRTKLSVRIDCAEEDLRSIFKPQSQATLFQVAVANLRRLTGGVVSVGSLVDFGQAVHAGRSIMMDLESFGHRPISIISPRNFIPTLHMTVHNLPSGSSII
jgi:hypothetical protein